MLTQITQKIQPDILLYLYFHFWVGCRSNHLLKTRAIERSRSGESQLWWTFLSESYFSPSQMILKSWKVEKNVWIFTCPSTFYAWVIICQQQKQGLTFTDCSAAGLSGEKISPPFVGICLFVCWHFIQSIGSLGSLSTLKNLISFRGLFGHLVIDIVYWDFNPNHPPEGGSWFTEGKI